MKRFADTQLLSQNYHVPVNELLNAKLKQTLKM